MTDWKYSLESVGFGLIVLSPFFQFAGQTYKKRDDVIYSQSACSSTSSGERKVYLAMFVSELDGFNDAQSLINGTTDRKIVDVCNADNLVGVNDKETSQCDAIRNEHCNKKKGQSDPYKTMYI